MDEITVLMGLLELNRYPLFPYRVRAVKLGYKPLTALFRTNLVRKRQIWPAAWCGLHYVRHEERLN